METVWVLMYMVVTCCGGGFGGNIYDPRWQKMPSEASCEKTKEYLIAGSMDTPTRKIQGIRCEGIPYDEFKSEFLSPN